VAEATPVPVRSPDFDFEQPGPFLKWAGGKKKLLDQYDEHFPEEYNRYFEPFVGGGAVYFHLNPDDAVISDINPRVVTCYKAIRDDLPRLVRLLKEHRAAHCKEYYYARRDELNAADGLDSTELAALMIYLNKTCFNGLYRENLSGEFNVPIGSYKNPGVFRIENLIPTGFQLRGTEIVCDDFRHVLDRAEEGDLVYFDPPYVPISDTSSFTSYAKGGFDDELQQELAKTFDKLAKRGCFVMLSNSDCGFVRELYRGWKIVSIEAPRRISAKKRGRGSVGEVLVKSWG
jgi:DNA adenine methylase